MQARRDAVRFSRSPEPDARVVQCDKGDVRIKSMAGQLIDDGDLEYEFVRYNRRTGLVIIAVFVSVGDTGAPIRMDALFPNMKEGEAYDADRVFLIARPTGDWTTAHLLAPTGVDAHATFGCNAAQSYLDRLLGEALA